MKREDRFLNINERGIDNLSDYYSLCGYFLGQDFPWFWNSSFFSHSIYAEDTPQSEVFDSIKPLLDSLDIISLIEVKAYSYIKTPEIIRYPFNDGNFYKETKTSIFYMNKNDGYTILESGRELESRCNRLITFPSMKYANTSCTNENSRVMININYF